MYQRGLLIGALHRDRRSPGRAPRAPRTRLGRGTRVTRRRRPRARARARTRRRGGGGGGGGRGRRRGGGTACPRRTRRGGCERAEPWRRRRRGRRRGVRRRGGRRRAVRRRRALRAAVAGALLGRGTRRGSRGARGPRAAARGAARGLGRAAGRARRASEGDRGRRGVARDDECDGARRHRTRTIVKARGPRTFSAARVDHPRVHVDRGCFLSAAHVPWDGSTETHTSSARRALPPRARLANTSGPRPARASPARRATLGA